MAFPRLMFSLVLIAFLALSISARECANGGGASKECNDHFEDCQQWRDDSGCDASLKIHCPNMCNTCNADTFLDMGIPQYTGEENPASVQMIVHKAYEYLKENGFTSCKNEFRECAWFASSGHCDSNKSLMEKSCAPVCQTCDKVGEKDGSKPPTTTSAASTTTTSRPSSTPSARLQEIEEKKAKHMAEEARRNGPGEKMKENEIGVTWDNAAGKAPAKVLETLRQAQLQAQLNPNPCNWSEEDNVWKVPGFIDASLDHMHYKQWYNTYGFHGEDANPPYFLIFNQFLSSWECKYLIDKATYDIGFKKRNNTLEYDSLICNDECEQDVIIKSILKRVEYITGIPNANSEHMEIRRYRNGGYKPLAHDYKEEERYEPQGVRVATFYLHLNTAFDGDTSAAWSCPYMGITASPQHGRGLFWVNVQDENLNEMEPTVEYEIKQADKSLQYAAVLHLHQRNYKDTRNCAARIDSQA